MDRALDGETLRLEDGRIVRVAGIIAPSAAARSRLDALTAGKAITLRPMSRPLDRWARVQAHIETPEGVNPAETLIAEGLGHAASIGRDTCLTPYLAAEARARAGKLGIWRDGGSQVPVRDITALTARLGQHVVAEGTLASGRSFRGRVYLNFAQYWKNGLSIVIAQRDWDALGKGASPEDLAGRAVRVRGWLEWRNGPAIVANPSEPIESLDGQPLAAMER
ncbi:thermonuclease family protein [Terrihabitans sp. B22-R8]|uniref:thermonuclease family protein n=1 Tax=Terrihabitans sp. B22-R8 TaxID=3425128 RepID=UPI00403C7E1F